MDAEDAKKAQLLEAIVELAVVKGAAFIDEQGGLSQIEGEADVFGVDESGQEDTAEEAHEDVLLEAIGKEYLVVAFPARGDFEAIQEKVTKLRERLDL